jgi:hypothetical protein
MLAPSSYPLSVVGLVFALTVNAYSADDSVDFSSEIRPLLEYRCSRCHGEKKRQGGLRLDRQTSVLRGGESGRPTVVPGHPEDSELLRRVRLPREHDEAMPSSGARLTVFEIALLERWIANGARWPADETAAPEYERAPLTPRRPKLPGEDGRFANPVDRFVDAYLREQGVDWNPPVEHRLLRRRLYLDLLGLLPLSDGGQDGGAQTGGGEATPELVDRLLARRGDYVRHWLTFWNDALRNDIGGIGYREDGRYAITSWLYNALFENLPYDRFVGELVAPKPVSKGFTHGIKWRGTVNASQGRPIQAAQNVAQVFLGLNLKCASCHDSFISDWKLADAYGLAAVYSDEPLELHRCDKPTGIMASPSFLFPELGEIDAEASRDERLRQLAAAMTSPNNGRLARTVVNRLWARFFGYGIVEPVDEMDNPPWSRDLLDWLAVDFVEHGYDLKHTMKRIVTSRAYALAAVASDEEPSGRGEFVFSGPLVRRLSAEQFVDAVSRLVGSVYQKEAVPWETAVELGDLDDPTWQLGAKLRELLGRWTASEAEQNNGSSPPARWIWGPTDDRALPQPGRMALRRVLDLEETPLRASAIITADNEWRLSVNGQSGGRGRDGDPPKWLDGLEGNFLAGRNVLAVSARNSGKEPNPAGVWFVLRLQFASGKTRYVVSDASWRCSPNEDFGWEQPYYSERQVASRAVLVRNDDLLKALGRTDREQVLTSRASKATLLQMLELSGGSRLYGVIRRGAEQAREMHDEPATFVETFYAAALGRPPIALEREAALEVVGDPMRSDGVEDFLWAVLMLPEFQLIY